ncbi:hypothetical protein L9F63_004203 [Diploptera punctata]|uniref:Ionotropic glutamate receptor C-terminal domain-containing protein n=1 Tax=Diploptera punctata TaxID=6984 RepID=A0AAD7ZGC8_DIPPU|nr:hypothetical protein L9F63_004203 [Diploptera punctata]
MAKDVIKLLWEKDNIVNSLVVSYTKLEENVTLNLYSWFPYEANQCSQVKEIVLLEQWENFRSIKNVSLFPPKIPDDMLGCPIRVTTSEFHPNVFLTQNETLQDGSVKYNFEGFDIDYLIYVVEASNLTVQFLPPPKSVELDQAYLERWANLQSGLADVTTGTLWWNEGLMYFGDPTTSYFEFSILWYIPCAIPSPRMEKVFAVFEPSLWMVICIVLILTAIVFSRLAICTSSELEIYRTISKCVCHVWAIFLGVSVPDLPRSNQLRFLFLLYVCYSLAIVTVFQAFFTSFLVDPGLGKQMKTIEELKSADVMFCRFKYYELISMSYNFLAPNALKSFPVDEWYECYYRVILNNNISSAAFNYHIQYTAALLGKTKELNNILCTMEEEKLTISLCLYLSKGNPLLDRFNKVIRRSLEAGLGEKSRSSIMWRTNLRYLKNVTDIDDEMYFVFTLSHFQIYFYTLFLGCLVSTIALFLELILDRALKLKDNKSLSCSESNYA